MKIGHFDETEQNDDVDDVDDMDDADDMDDVDDMDDTEDMDDAEGDMDSPEDGEDADEGEDSGEEKMSIADKIKDKLSSMFKSKETDDAMKRKKQGKLTSLTNRMKKRSQMEKRKAIPGSFRRRARRTPIPGWLKRRRIFERHTTWMNTARSWITATTARMIPRIRMNPKPMARKRNIAGKQNREQR